MTVGPVIIFVVDDDQAVRESLKFALDLDGFEVRPCDSGAELLCHPELRHARCIVLDYEMPGLDGLDVLDRLAAQNVEIPVIMISGRATPRLLRQASNAGARRVLEKPLMGDALAQGIRDVLSSTV